MEADDDATLAKIIKPADSGPIQVSLDAIKLILFLLSQFSLGSVVIMITCSHESILFILRIIIKSYSPEWPDQGRLMIS